MQKLTNLNTDSSSADNPFSESEYDEGLDPPVFRKSHS